MLLDDYIAVLQKLRADHGNLPVETLGICRNRIDAPAPRLAYRKILVGRESKPDFLMSSDPAVRRGEPVIRV